MLRMIVIAFALVSGPVAAADVTVTVKSLKAKGGTVIVGLWDESGFMKADSIVTAKADGSKAGEVTVRLADVPPGDYAVNAFHDADGNGRMTMANGRMSEGTALSNAEALRGSPSFAVNKIAVPVGGTNVAVRMSYPEDRQGW